MTSKFYGKYSCPLSITTMQGSLTADTVRFAKAQRSIGGITFSFLILIHILKHSSTCTSLWSDPDLHCSLPHFLRLPLCIVKHKKTRNKTKMWEKESDKNLVTMISCASDGIGGCCETGSCADFKNILYFPQSGTALWVDLEDNIMHRMDDLGHGRFCNRDVHHCHFLSAFSLFLNVWFSTVHFWKVSI